jgi:hypothetical protein
MNQIKFSDLIQTDPQQFNEMTKLKRQEYVSKWKTKLDKILR